MRPFEKWTLWVTTILAGGSGLALLWVKYTMEPANAWDAVNHPIQPWLLKLHIVTSPMLIFAVGLVTLEHIWKHFRLGVKKARRTGLTAMLTLAPMVLSGYLIQAVTHEGWLRIVAWAHIITGSLFLVGFLLHGWAASRKNGYKNGHGVGAARDREAGEPERYPDGASPDVRSVEAPAQPRNRQRQRRKAGVVTGLLVLTAAPGAGAAPPAVHGTAAGLGAPAVSSGVHRAASSGKDRAVPRPGAHPGFRDGTTRTYYVAAEEVSWDYAPAGRDVTMGREFRAEDSVFVVPGSGRVGSVYRKAVYRAYTDSTFTERAAVPEEWHHKGLLGPVLRAEVGDTIRVVFRNLGSRSYTMHPHGVFYDKASEGAPTNDGTAGGDKADDGVAPGGTHTYVWPVPERAGPGPADPSSVVWLYHSHVDEPADTNAGLIGVIVVTRAGMADAEARPVDVDREFVSLFKVFDENASGLLTGSLEASGVDPADVELDDEAFREGNLMHAINGYVYGSMPMLRMTAGERTRWYIVDLGTEIDLHTAHWHGNTGLVRGHRTDVVELMPGSMKVADLVPDNPGIWMYHCHVDDHIAAGMTARYHVLEGR